MTTEDKAPPAAPPQPGSRSIWSRMVRAARIDISLYEEVEHESQATGQAFIVVLLVALASGVGMGLSYAMDAEVTFPFIRGLLTGLGTGIGGWLLWSLFAYWLGTSLFRGPETEATYGQLLRTLGFANTPGLLRLFAFIPYLGGLIAFVAFVWSLIAGIIAVRQALDFSTWRAIGTCIVGWILYILLVALVGVLIGGATFLF
ncbi:MAG: hypothetical protein FJ020_07870 [Chloroflexi bacterium]|nr:hypothetical protein [Chloroflexota bacterium]